MLPSSVDPTLCLPALSLPSHAFQERPIPNSCPTKSLHALPLALPFVLIAPYAALLLAEFSIVFSHSSLCIVPKHGLAASYPGLRRLARLRMSLLVGNMQVWLPATMH